MRRTTKKTKCDICGRRCSLSKEQRDCYKKIPKNISPVWHPSFTEAGAKARFFGQKAKRIDVSRWKMFPQTARQADETPRRMVLTKADEAQLFLRYNYARLRLSRLAERQRKRATKARAIAMLEWHDRVQNVRSDLVGANMSLVLAMAKRTRIPNVEFPERISEGNMALLRAIDKFDVSRGYKFSTYACRAIQKGFNRMASKAGRYYSRFGVPYDPEMDRSDYDVNKHEMQQAMAADDLREVIAKNRADLSETERTIVIERFGLTGGDKGKTLSEVGKVVGLSNERVRQLQNEALAKIRRVLNERYLAA